MSINNIIAEINGCGHKKGDVVNNFCACSKHCPRFLIHKLGNNAPPGVPLEESLEEIHRHYLQTLTCMLHLFIQTSLMSSRSKDVSETMESVGPAEDSSPKMTSYANDLHTGPYVPPPYPSEKDKELRVSLFSVLGEIA